MSTTYTKIPPDGGTGVTSLNSETGAVTLVAGSNITITPAGQNITIASTGGTTSPLTTKGDLYTYTTTDARLPVGANGYILSSDSGQATGLNWIANTGGGGTPGGSNQQIQYNNSGAFGGAAAVYFDNGSNYFGAGLLNTGTLTLSHDFQVGGGNSYLPPTSVAGAITYYTPPIPPSGSSISATYFQKLIDSVSLTALQVDGAFPGYYLADGTNSLSFYVAPYAVVSGTKIYGPGLTTTAFTDNSDASNFYIQLDWAAVTGASGYVIWRNGTYTLGAGPLTATYESIDVGNIITYQDTGFSYWANTIAYPPTPNTLAYQALGNSVDYHIYDYITAAGVNLYSTTSTNLSFTDDNRSAQGPASGSISSSTAGGTYSSSGNYTHSYRIWSAYPDGGFSGASNYLPKSITVTDTTVGSPTGFSATPNYGSGSYTANGNTFNYFVRAFYNAPAGYIYSPVAVASFTDDSSTNPFSVDLVWTAPTGTVPTGYIIYLNNGQFALTYGSQNVGNVLLFNDNSGGWGSSYPYLLNALNNPTSLSAVQNDAETGYTADGTNIFTFNLSAYWNTPLGRAYSYPTACSTGFTDNSDLSTFGIDLGWTVSTTDPNGSNPDGYELWVVGGVHALNTAQDVGNVSSFIDQNNTWSTLSYQIYGSAAYNFLYEIQLSWSAVTGVSGYYIVKTAGDSGPSYPIYITQAGASLTDTDDSLWTAAAMNPPTPEEQPTSYEVLPVWTGVGGITYRALRQVNGGGFTTYHDTASGASGFVDGNYSFSWLGSPTVTNTLYHATGANIPIKAYSFDNADAVYSPTFASNSVTDDNSSRYYSILWTASNYPTGADKLKLVINTSNGELLTSPTLTYTDTNGAIAYNSDTVVTPNSVTSKFFSDRVGNVTIDTLTCLTTIITPKIGSGTGLVQLGVSANAAGTNSISMGLNSSSVGTSSVSVGHASSSGGNSSVAYGPGANASGAGAVALGSGTQATFTDATAIGDSATAGNSAALAIGVGASCTSSGGAAIGNGAVASNFQSLSVGYATHATGTAATALGFGATAGGSQSFAGSYQANSSGTNSIAIGVGSSCSASQGIAIGTSTSSSGNPAGIAIGQGSSTGANYSLAIGYVATASGGTDIAIGFGANSSGGDSVIVGPASSTTSSFTTCLGYSNVIHTSCNGSNSIGYSNSITTSGNASILGYTNSITNSANAILLGSSNTIGTGSGSSQLLGVNSTISTSSASAAIGYNNSITGANNTYVFGQSNTAATISGGFGAFAFGQGNTLGGISSFAIGQGLSPGAGFMQIGYGSVNPIITLNSNNNRIGINNASPTVLFDINGTANAKIYKFQGSTSGSITVQPAAIAGSWTMTLPVKATPTNGLLQTDGTGISVWADPIVNNDEVICYADSIVYLT